MNKSFKLYGDGTNIREWVYVKDHCTAIDKVFNFSKVGEKYNIGGGFEISNIDLIKYIYSLSKTEEKFIFVEDRFGHDFRYSLNIERLKKILIGKLNLIYLIICQILDINISDICDLS